MSEPVHRPRPGVRVARICTKCLRREIGNPHWTCPVHGKGTTVAQPNNPYFGQSTA